MIRDGNFPEDGGPVKKINPGGSSSPNGNGGPDKSRKPPRMGEEPPNGFRRINGGGGGSDPSDDDGDWCGSIPPSSKILHQQEDSIGGPSLFMYCRDLLDHQIKWDNQDKQVEMEEMAKHPN